jgi:prolyl 4-hydroxylase
MHKILPIVIFATMLLLILYLRRDATKHESYISIPDYRIQEIPNFLTPQECDIVIGLSRERLVDSQVYSNEKDVVNTSTRESKQYWLNDNVHPIVERISQRTAEITRTPVVNQEPLQVVNYSPGGFFRPHYDACDGSATFCERMNSKAGPRYITLLIYLNDDFTGGETAFPLISNPNKLCKPERGKAVLFYNTDLDGNIIEQALHGGNSITSGNKWICNKWVHLGEYS